MKRLARGSNGWFGSEQSEVKTTACKLKFGRAVARAIVVAEVLLAGCSTITSPAVSPIGSANYVQPVRPSSSAPAPHQSSRIVTASRYSPDLTGNCTSNGERYNPNSLTAASRSLPMGLTVKVTNVNNGLSVDARINDRGPYVPGRSLDLSTRAARDIGLRDRGLAKVKITPQPSSASSPSAPCD